jgi:hypothetical protein
MSELTVKGTIKLINEIRVVSDKFSVREFVLTMGEKYSQDILFQTVNDKMDIIAPYQVGQQVDVSFNLRGREYAAPGKPVKYYNTLDAYKIIGTAVIPQQTEDNGFPF